MKPIGTLMFPFILWACVAGAIMLPLVLLFVTLYRSFRAIPNVLRVMYREVK